MSEYEELAFYTLAHGDPAFIHQHVVDAWMLQTADETTKPIAIHTTNRIHVAAGRLSIR